MECNCCLLLNVGFSIAIRRSLVAFPSFGDQIIDAALSDAEMPGAALILLERPLQVSIAIQHIFFLNFKPFHS